ncbi:MAG TPA: hypothetical protein VF759_10405 [Allosphingosinicella sp.]
MPIVILWAEAALPHMAAVHRWLANMGKTNLHLGKWLKTQVRQAEQIDRQTAGLPIFAYYNTALTVRVADIQLGSLLTEPVMGVGAHLRRALEQWDIPEDVRRQARSANLPNEALRVIEEMSVGVLASLDRFAAPTVDMYDPSKRTASDLIGLAALTFRTVGANRQGLFLAARRLFKTLKMGQFGEDVSWKATAYDPVPLPADMRVDELNRYVVAALLFIPGLSAIVQQVGRDALLAVRYRVLAKFESFEKLALDYRRKMLVGFRDGVAAVTEAALQLFVRIGGTATGFITAFAAIGEKYMRGVTNGVVRFARQLETLWKNVSRIVDAVVAYGTALVSVDLGKVVHKGLLTIERAIQWLADNLYDEDEPPAKYEAPAQFPVTIGELVLREGAGVKALAHLQVAITRLTAAVRGAGGIVAIGAFVHWLQDGEVHIHNIMTGLDMLNKSLNEPRMPLAGQPVLKVDVSGAPDLVADVVNPLRKGLTGVVATLGTGAGTAVGDIFGALETTLTDTGDAFSKEAASSVRGPRSKLMRNLSGDVDSTVRAMFAEQSVARRKSGLDDVGAAFGAWMQGGFETLANLASGYLRFMLDEWLVHTAKGRDLPVQISPASPKKLLERAELGRVHMPKLRLVAYRDSIDRPLAEDFADEFKLQIETAYRTGLGRMAEFTALAA